MRTIEEVAKLTGYNKSHIRRLVRLGRIKAKRKPIPGREKAFRYEIPENEVQRLVETPRDNRGSYPRD